MPNTPYSLWTTVQEFDDRVVVRVARGYAWGMVAGVIIIGYLAMLFVANGIEAGGLHGGIMIVIAALVVWRFTLYFFKQPRAGATVALIPDHVPASLDRDQKNIVTISEIASLRVSKRLRTSSKGRDLAQTFIERKGKGPILIYQSYWRSRSKALEVAQRLAERWGVPVRGPDEHSLLEPH